MFVLLLLLLSLVVAGGAWGEEGDYMNHEGRLCTYVLLVDWNLHFRDIRWVFDGRDVELCAR